MTLKRAIGCAALAGALVLLSGLAAASEGGASDGWGTGGAKLYAGFVEPKHEIAWMMCVPAKSVAQGAYWVSGMRGSTIGTLDPSSNTIAENVPARMVWSFAHTGVGLSGVWVTNPDKVAVTSPEAVGE